jgi:membrane protein
MGVFLQLRDAIHTIWHIAEKPIGTIKGFLKTRVVGFTLLLGIGFLLLVSLVVSTVLTALSRYLGGFVSEMEAVVKIIDFFVSLFFITLLFALIFRILPDARMKWKDLWVGSAFIALLFTLGKMAIGLYLGSSKVASTFGAASSLVIVLLWVFYSAQIFLFGAEFTKIFANRFGAQILPDEDAMRVKIEKVEVPTKGGHGE